MPNFKSISFEITEVQEACRICPPHVCVMQRTPCGIGLTIKDGPLFFIRHLTTMVIDKIRKITVKGVKLKSKGFFLISPGVLELWRKNLRGVDSSPPHLAWIGLRRSGVLGTFNFDW